MNTLCDILPAIKPRNPNISILWEEDQKDLIEKLAQAITQHGTMEGIQCLASGIELHLENTPDFCEEHIKDQDLIKEVLDAVANFADSLKASDAKTSMGCRNMRRIARQELLAAISDIKVN